MSETPETVICEEWALPLTRVETFLLAQNEVRSLGQGRFRFKGCVLELRTLPERRIGSLPLPCLSLEYSGKAEDIAALRRRFLLRFLSAGG